MGSLSFSLFTCFEAVSDDTRLWKPDTSPHATVIKRIENMEAEAEVKPVSAGRFIAGLDTKMLGTAL